MSNVDRCFAGIFLGFLIGMSLTIKTDITKIHIELKRQSETRQQILEQDMPKVINKLDSDGSICMNWHS